MTREEILKIDELRRQGLGYTKIARSLGLNANTVKTYCSRHILGDGGCMLCGKLLHQTPGHRQRKFCSDYCRSGWWNRHRYEQECGKKQKHTCPCCGKEFLGYGHRVYCSVQCYANGRRKQDE